MKVYIERNDEEKEFSLDGEKRKIKDVLKEMNIKLSSVILVKNGEICLEDEVVCDDDRVEILSVVSGG